MIKKNIHFLVIELLFLTILILVYIFYINYLQVNVVLYDAIKCVLIAVFLNIILLFLFYKKSFSQFEKLQIFIINLLIGYILALSVPTIIDRSFSFYILEKLHQIGGTIQLEDSQNYFIENFTKEHRLMDVRLTEQLESGTIVIENNCIKLTDWGETVASFGLFFRNNFLPKKRLLMGEYTDDLTNPFRDNQFTTQYQCK